MAKRNSGVTKKTSTKLPAWFWMLLGSGITLMAIFALYLINPFAKKAPILEEQPKEQVNLDEASEDYNFYELLPEQQVEITGEPEDSIVVTSGLEEQSEQVTSTEETVAIIEPEPQVPSTSEQNDSPNQNNTQITSTEPAQLYVLKLGVFQDPNEADRQRARVLLTGIVAEVQTSIGANGVVYSLVSESFSNRRRALNAQQQLQSGGVESVITEVSGY